MYNLPMDDRGLPNCPVKILEDLRNNFDDQFIRNCLSEIIRLRRRQDDLLVANNRLIEEKQRLRGKINTLLDLNEHHIRGVRIVAEKNYG